MEMVINFFGARALNPQEAKLGHGEDGTCRRREGYEVPVVPEVRYPIKAYICICIYIYIYTYIYLKSY